MEFGGKNKTDKNQAKKNAAFAEFGNLFGEFPE